MRHKCDRNNCNTIHVNGPKVKCAKCKNLCYLMCYGFSKGETKDGHETVKIILPNGGALHSILSCCSFVCCDDSMPTTDVKPALKIPNNNRATSATRAKNTEINENNLIMKEINEMKNELSLIKAAINGTKSNTELIMKNNRHDLNRFRANEYTSPLPKISYAQSVKNVNLTPSLKRPRLDTSSKTPLNEKFNVPPAKTGTKTNTALSVVPKKTPTTNINDRTKYEKSIWISRLQPTVTNEEIVNHITSHTSITDKNRFNVHKLVKKDCDLTSLKFVSFKISLNACDFDVLNDPAVWPEGAKVREFIPNITLGNFFPPLNVKSKDQSEQIQQPDTPQATTSKETMNNSPTKSRTKSNKTP